MSKQNLGYDAEGTDPHGRRICLEIKKVDRPDTPFSLTTNEWALVQSRAEPMMLAIVVGDGHSSRLALFDPLAAGITPIRVARQMGVAVRELGGPHYLGRIGLPGAAVLAGALAGAVTLAALTGCSGATASPGASASVAERGTV